MLSVVEKVSAQPVNDTGTYWKLDDRLEPVECNRTAWEAFRAAGGHIVAKTYFGEIASVETEFDGLDDLDEDDPHPFLTMTSFADFSEAEGHRTWGEAEAAHRQRVDEMKARIAQVQLETEPLLFGD